MVSELAAEAVHARGDDAVVTRMAGCIISIVQKTLARVSEKHLRGRDVCRALEVTMHRCID
jgi:hypothetical protein